MDTHPIDTAASNVIALDAFIDEFGDGLLDTLNHTHPPVYDGQVHPERQAVMDALARQPFPAQADVVQAMAALLLDQHAPAGVINAEMGTGKTMMAIAVAAVMAHAGYRRSLIVSPPHLVYKWRREILETVPNARVWVLNGPDTLAKLLKLREQLGQVSDDRPEFYVLGRVRMRMGFHWVPVAVPKRTTSGRLAACPDCGQPVRDGERQAIPFEVFKHTERRQHCLACGGMLWSLIRQRSPVGDARRQRVTKALQRIPTIGKVTSEKLIDRFGEAFLSSMLADNVHEFINLMDDDGELVFNDRQAVRMERAMANIEFGFGEGGFQPSEFIKRYLPDRFFDLLIVDEGHEYKNAGSAQGQAMGVLAAKARKTLLLTGTLMGGYADDLFYLLFRILTPVMIEDGFKPLRNSLGAAAMAFMREHGVLKDTFTEHEGVGHKTAKGRKTTVRTTKAPGFGPKGILRYVLPFTVFLKLRDIGGEVLPPCEEQLVEVPMDADQATAYEQLATALTRALQTALANRDTTLLGVVLNVLLAWPDCCFRPETVTHPRTRELIHFTRSIFDDTSTMPKEDELVTICREAQAQGRKVLAYTTYTGKRDTTSRLKRVLEQAGLKVAVLRSTVDTGRREDWIADQVEKGIDVLITNPELVKTGLDLLDFPTIVFMQTGWNVYTLQQAARRSWRIGQRQPVKVLFLGYAGTSQMSCLKLMATKIAVAQSTSGDIPASGLDALNTDGESVEMELARQLVA